jgi:hypothetical protein
MDLQQLLQQFLDQQHEILLMGDFYEDMDDHSPATNFFKNRVTPIKRTN